MAVSGAVSFNTATVRLNSQTPLTKGESLTTGAGASIPSTILYTDELGGKTHYIPVRKFAEALNMPVSWNSSRRRMDIQVEGELSVCTLPLTDAGTVYDDALQEVEPKVSATGDLFLPATDHQSAEPFEAALSLSEKHTGYISITVTNHGDHPLEFALGQRYGDTNAEDPLSGKRRFRPGLHLRGECALYLPPHRHHRLCRSVQ